jgi:hypothetical protein
MIGESAKKDVSQDDSLSQNTRVKRNTSIAQVMDKEHKRTKERTIGYIIEKVS